MMEFRGVDEKEIPASSSCLKDRSDSVVTRSARDPAICLNCEWVLE